MDEINVFKQKEDKLFPDAWKLTVREALRKNKDGNWEVNLRKTNIGAIPTGSTLRPQGFFLTRLGAFHIPVKIGDTVARFPTASSKVPIPIFENSQQEIYELIWKCLNNKTYEDASPEYTSLRDKDVTVKDVTIKPDSGAILGNWCQSPVKEYHPHGRDAEGTMTPLYPTRKGLDGKLHEDKDNKVVMNVLRYFVHISEDKEVVFSREYRLRVKPYLIEATTTEAEEIIPEDQGVAGEEKTKTDTEKEKTTAGDFIETGT